jgi:hypothetical protein
MARLSRTVFTVLTVSGSLPHRDGCLNSNVRERSVRNTQVYDFVEAIQTVSED